MKGLIAYVYRSELRATNGPSEFFDRVVVVGEGVPEIFSPSADMPVMYLVSTSIGIPVLVPKKVPNGVGPYMFGGNYASTSDSRFDQIVRQMAGVNDWRQYIGPIMIFDRTE